MSDYEPVLVDAPSVLPVSREECKQHLRIDGSDEDGLIDIYLLAAVNHLDGANGWLGRSIVAQSWSQQFDVFLPGLLLQLAPVSAISNVKYTDAAGVEQTVAPSSYQLINPGSEPEVRFLDTWESPAIGDDRPAVKVNFVSGYGDDTDVPAAIKVAILLMVGDMYQVREAKLDGAVIENSTVRRLLDPYRTKWVA